jgi:hypothetical protein
MVDFSKFAHLDRSLRTPYADWAVVAVAVALPWSTSAVGIAIAVWLVLSLLTLDGACIKRELATAAGGLPVLLWCLGAIGMLWANVGWHDRFAGLDGFHRLLVIPLLLAQFRRTGNGIWVASGFFISSIALLIASYAIAFAFGDRWHGSYGVPVHDTIFQGSIFLICAFGALGYAVLAREKKSWPWQFALFAIGALFLINFAFVTTSRSALLIAPLLLVLFGWRLFGWKGALSALLLAAILGSAMWVGSPILRDRIARSVFEIEKYHDAGEATSIGEHIAFLRESISIVASAPIMGHGTGSIGEEFRRITAGKTGAAAMPTVNPHNQTFAVAIQLGLVGAAVLWAMWIAHMALFTGSSAAAWLGFVLVTENIVSSTVHSHLFDFNSGWLYVFGVGVLGGTILGDRDRASKRLNSAIHEN